MTLHLMSEQQINQQIFNNVQLFLPFIFHLLSMDVLQVFSISQLLWDIQSLLGCLLYGVEVLLFGNI